MLDLSDTHFAYIQLRRLRCPLTPLRARLRGRDISVRPLLEVLALLRGDNDQTPFAELYQASQRSRVRIFAENSPFDLKDRLKERGYRWSDGSDGRPKSWWIEIAEEGMEDELRFLRAEIYRWEDADPPVQRLTAFDRFRSRK